MLRAISRRDARVFQYRYAGHKTTRKWLPRCRRITSRHVRQVLSMVPRDVNKSRFTPHSVDYAPTESFRFHVARLNGRARTSVKREPASKIYIAKATFFLSDTSNWITNRGDCPGREQKKSKIEIHASASIYSELQNVRIYNTVFYYVNKFKIYYLEVLIFARY